ncbi:FdhE protein [Maridesulfovibrio ferrireducens]|uniref:FdhE protein n=1 Tax=Maridesulfovibrio ferrireducens TaxID=246191 RepID=A0A1G9FID4_9BACT|nr:formate dehydrogenase accessory protein FdhE [Maridesulfovibrio ferrireducens]SDK88146.1 FdhE protein [Maridesulfovibrio ferrireducens]
MTFDYSKAQHQLDKKIKNLNKKDFLPDELVDLISNVAKIQLEAEQQAAPVMPDPASFAPAAENIQGRPLLARADFPYDHDQAVQLFTKFSDILLNLSGPIADATKFISDKIENKELDLEKVFSAYIKGDDSFFAKWGEDTPEAPRTLNFLIQSSVTPSIKVVARNIAEHLPEIEKAEEETPTSVDLEIEVSPPPARNHGHCPVCGSIPFIHVLRHKQGFRYADCSFCHTEYRVRRLACAYCDESDSKKIKFFTAEGEPGYRVEVCDSCNNYIKTIDFRELDKVSIPTLDDLESLPLDFLAVEEGYKRGTLSAWGF